MTCTLVVKDYTALIVQFAQHEFSGAMNFLVLHFYDASAQHMHKHCDTAMAFDLNRVA